MKKSKKGFTLFIAVFLFLCSVSSVNAYELNPWSWPKQYGQTYTINVKYTTLVENYRNTWDQAVSDWNGSQSKISFNLSAIHVGSPNLVGTMSDPDQSLYGECYTTKPNNVLTSFQAYINSSNSNISSNSTIRRSTANHELGHAMGLKHYNGSVQLAVMNSNRDRTKVYTPKTDDINGVNAKYAF